MLIPDRVNFPHPPDDKVEMLYMVRVRDSASRKPGISSWLLELFTLNICGCNYYSGSAPNNGFNPLQSNTRAFIGGNPSAKLPNQYPQLNLTVISRYLSRYLLSVKWALLPDGLGLF